MRTILVFTTLAFAATWVWQGTASAQWPAPVGHRQPTAESVPASDSVFGSAGGTEHRSAAEPSANPSATNPIDDGLSFPNICSNCDQ